MLGKTGTVSLGLMCLIAMASSVYCGEASQGQEAPTIGVLEAFARGAREAPVADVAAQIVDAEAKLEAGKPYLAKDVLDLLAGEELSAEQAERVEALGTKAEKAIARKEKDAAKKVGLLVSPETDERAGAFLEGFLHRSKVQQQVDKVKAAELVEEAKHQLYHERDPQEAYKLATRAVELDPANTEAQDLKTEAGLELGILEEELKFQARKATVLPQVRKQVALQTLRNALARAKALYADEKYEEALNQLRQARIHVASLSAYMDMEAQRREVEALQGLFEEAYEKARLELAIVEREEAARKAEERISGILGVERKRRARLVEEIDKLIDDKRFEESLGVLDDLEFSDPSDELVPRLREKLRDEEHKHQMALLNARGERGDAKVYQGDVERELTPERVFDYPSKPFWKNVVEKRGDLDAVWARSVTDRTRFLYPSTHLEDIRPEWDLRVRESLQDQVSLSFRDTPLPDVVDFLEQTTDVSYAIIRQDMPPDQAPVSLTLETTLENALDQICDLAGMDWTVEGGLVKIGS
ncbi:MAG: hypothetical protein KAX44_00635, partial [Candidatus Brocadiae bacterium]|nr:hypothetical protein [Candidatus Brocadiia bacterium]